MAARGGKDSKVSATAVKCLKCCTIVKDDDAALQCEVCEGWSHTRCENISEEGYKVLQMENIHWYCNACNKGIGKVIVMMSKIQQRQDKLEMDWKSDFHKFNKEYDSWRTEVSKRYDEWRNAFQIRLEKQEKGVAQLENELRKMKEEDGKRNDPENSLWSEVVSKEVEKKIGSVKGEMYQIEKSVIEAREAIEEEKEKERRRNNIIIYRMPESRAPSAEARWKDDCGFLQDLFEQVLGLNVDLEADVDSILRLGRKYPDVTRPMLVAFKSATVKNEVIESLYKLGTADTVFKSLSITHDLTQKERSDCKKLVIQAKEHAQQDSSGEWIYRVRGPPSDMKVIRIRKRLPTQGHRPAQEQPADGTHA